LFLLFSASFLFRRTEAKENFPYFCFEKEKYSKENCMDKNHHQAAHIRAT